jgi:sulfite exporter TauE/SafE/copper chaperone CopZ
MTCLGCQNKIERKLRRTAGVARADVSYGAGTADISYDADVISMREVVAVIEGLGYRVSSGGGNSGASFGRVAGFLAVIIALYVLLQQSGMLNLLVPSRLADTGMGYGMLFVIGLVTSVHCIAMCGGINISQCIPRAGPAPPADLNAGPAPPADSNAEPAPPADLCAAPTARHFLMPALQYNLGRVISYTVIGGVLGFVGLMLSSTGGGADAGLSPTAQGVMKLVAGIFMVIMGMNMLGLFPLLRRLQPRIPNVFARKPDEGNAGRTESKSPLVVGLLNGLMPCGPLQSMQIVALASGSPLAGAFSMLLFSLGTVPLMLGLGSVVSALGRRFAGKVMNVGAVLVVVLGLAILSQGGSLSSFLPPDTLLAIVVGLCVVGIASSIPFQRAGYKTVSTLAAVGVAVLMVAVWNTPGTLAVGGLAGDSGRAYNGGAEVVDGVQIINSTLEPGSFPDIDVEVGMPVRWTINAPSGSLNGCNNRIVIPEYGLQVGFEQGDNVIEFTPDKPGSFGYSCWMGMIRGTITVAEASAVADGGGGADDAIRTDDGAGDNASADDGVGADDGYADGGAETTDPLPAGGGMGCH